MNDIQAVDHRRQAHAALARAHDYLDLHARHVDPLSPFQTHHHAWIARYCLIMASIALHVAANHARARPRLTC
jgi:hypothetical protein